MLFFGLNFLERVKIKFLKFLLKLYVFSFQEWNKEKDLFFWVIEPEEVSKGCLWSEKNYSYQCMTTIFIQLKRSDPRLKRNYTIRQYRLREKSLILILNAILLQKNISSTSFSVVHWHPRASFSSLWCD